MGLLSLRPDVRPSVAVLQAVFMAEMILVGQLAGLVSGGWWPRAVIASAMITLVSLVISSFEVLRLAGVLMLVIPCGSVMGAMFILRWCGVTAGGQVPTSRWLLPGRHWTLADLMLLTLLVASVMAVLRNSSFNDVRHLRGILWINGMFSAFAVTVSLVTLWACLGEHPWRRIPVVFALAVSAALLVFMAEISAWVTIVKFAVLCSGLVVASLLIVRRTGVRLMPTYPELRIEGNPQPS